MRRRIKWALIIHKFLSATASPPPPPPSFAELNDLKFKSSAAELPSFPQISGFILSFISTHAHRSVPLLYPPHSLPPNCCWFRICRKPRPGTITQSYIHIIFSGCCTCISPYICQFFAAALPPLAPTHRDCYCFQRSDNPFRVHFHQPEKRQCETWTVHTFISRCHDTLLACSTGHCRQQGWEEGRGSDGCIKFGGIIGCPSELSSIGNETNDAWAVVVDGR